MGLTRLVYRIDHSPGSEFVGTHTARAQTHFALARLLVHRHGHRNSILRILAVVQIIAVVGVVKVNIIVVVPIVRPILRPWIDDTDPVSAVPEARISAEHCHTIPTQAERMLRSKVFAITELRDPVTDVAAAFPPVPMLRPPIVCAMFIPDARELNAPSPIQVDADGNSVLRIPTIVQVIAVTGVVNVHIIVLIPVARPIFRPRVNNIKVKTVVLESRMSANHRYGMTIDPERVGRPEMPSVPVLRNPVTVVTAALPPIAVFRSPIVCATLLPDPTLFDLLPVLLLRSLHFHLLRTVLLRAALLLGALVTRI